jgi:hypothetical protein
MRRIQKHSVPFSRFVPQSLSSTVPLALIQFLHRQLKDIGTGLSTYIPDIIRGVRYQDHFGRRYWEGRMLLGQITETVVELLPLYCEVGADLINSQNRGRGLLAGENGSQEWVLHIVGSFEDSRILPRGSTDRAKGCPRQYT